MHWEKPEVDDLGGNPEGTSWEISGGELGLDLLKFVLFSSQGIHDDVQSGVWNGQTQNWVDNCTHLKQAWTKRQIGRLKFPIWNPNTESTCDAIITLH